MNDQKPAQHHHSPRPPLKQIIRSVVGAFLGIGAVAALDQMFLSDSDLIFVIGAFGATAVLIYGAPYSPLAQPYNVMVGHLISAVIGVAAFQLVGEVSWISAALAVSLAIAAMQVTRSVHPPGGASALIAVTASEQVHDLGFLYALYPVGLGALVLVVIALITNNLLNEKKWPIFWY